MPPTLALSLYVVLLATLLWLDRARGSERSPALWIPVIWIFFVATRLPSQWIGDSQTFVPSQALEEGNSTDRSIFIILIILSIIVLVSRSFQWRSFFTLNRALIVFLLFAALSACWSDFPLVSIKRWSRDLGNYLAVLVVLTHPDPVEALRTVMRRLSYLLIPISVLLIKYFREMGLYYNSWTGTETCIGAASSKNSLGALCVGAGIFLLWDILTTWPSRHTRASKRRLLVNATLLAMNLWLLQRSHSATSLLCLLLGFVTLVAVNSSILERRPRLFALLVPTCVLLCPFLVFTLNLRTQIAEAVGRDPTLTERTQIWDFLTTMETNPILGTGYDSFWLGDRLQAVASRFGPLNEAHNGYLEIYLNLGIAGLALFVVFLIVSYRSALGRAGPMGPLRTFGITVWSVVLIYNVTESAFSWDLMWIIFLLGTLAVPMEPSDFGDTADDVMYAECDEALAEQPVPFFRARDSLRSY
jgi:exopolysaccharide production protein ExoQ